MEMIGHTSEANLLDYPGRSNLWSRLPPNIRTLYLGATADGWLDKFFSGSEANASFESLVQSEIIDRFRLRFDPMSANALRRLTSFSGYFPRFKEPDFRNIFEQWLEGKRRLKVLDGKACGQLIVKRRWNSIAALVYTVYRHGNRDDLRPILLECTSLLGTLTRIQIFFSGELEIEVSEDEWWDTFSQIAIDLYPWGPEHKEVWSRAGGEYNSVRDGSGNDKWHDVLRQLRKGGGGRKIKVERLLRTMLDDYSNNENLKLMARSYDELT